MPIAGLLSPAVVVFLFFSFHVIVALLAAGVVVSVIVFPRDRRVPLLLAVTPSEARCLPHPASACGRDRSESVYGPLSAQKSKAHFGNNRNGDAAFC